MARRKQNFLIEEDDREIAEKALDSCSSDDAEANADLTLRVAERATLNRAEKLRTVGIDVARSFVGTQVKTSRKSKNQKSCYTEVPSLIEEKHDGSVNAFTESAVVPEVANGTAAAVPDDNILRRLLRGPRYFDPPESGCTMCFNCGEDGHIAVNCTSSVKKLKPCFVCGSLDHLGRRCPKGIDCFFCRQSGHRAKDCPEKWNKFSNDLNVCLKCGDSGHDMFSCVNDYALKDLEKIQCYVCKNIGHLCCVKYENNSKNVVSCYRCGEAGHEGPVCSTMYDYNIAAYPQIIEKSSRAKKRKLGSKSASAVLEKITSKKQKKKAQNHSSEKNSSKRGRWITEDPEDASKKARNRSSEKTPTKRGGWITEDPEHTTKASSKGWKHKSPITPSPSERVSSSRKGYSAQRGSEQRHSSSRSGYSGHWNGHSESNGQHIYHERSYDIPTQYRRRGSFANFGHSRYHSGGKNDFETRSFGDHSLPYKERHEFEDVDPGSNGGRFNSYKKVSSKERQFW